MTFHRIALAALLVLTSLTLGCGDNDNQRPDPNPTLTPASFVCSGPEGPPTACTGGSSCCGNQCIGPNQPCCEIPAGRPNAGQTFVCASRQQCCGVGCIQVGSPCT